MVSSTLPALVQALLRPEFYPHQPESVELVQTHISYVFLAGDRVYKIKKPVRFAFLDFSTLELRRHYCREELRLNRRLAGDVYRRVVAIRRSGASWCLGEESAADAVEYAVEMQRLPADRMFSEMLARGEANEGDIVAIAERLVEFHRAADHGPEVTANGSPEKLHEAMALDFSEADRYLGRTITARDHDAIQRFCLDFVTSRAALFRDRQAQGRIRECHGDLRAEHICFTDRLAMIDCIEFDAVFRNRDVAAEVAFLAMDIENLGHPGLARMLVERYARLAGDDGVSFLVPFYECHLAYIRGKVESLKSLEGEVDAAGRECAAASAKRHFELANRYTWSYTPMVIAVAGLSGSGKTTIAQALCQRTGFVHVSSDVLRKELAGCCTDSPSPPDARDFLYSEEHGRVVYESMVERALQALRGGNGVVVDATFQRRANREQVGRLGREMDVPVLFVECQCDPEEARRRLDRRVRAGVGPSDADWRVYLDQVACFEAFSAEERGEMIQVDSTAPLRAVVDQIEDEARQRTVARID